MIIVEIKKLAQDEVLDLVNRAKTNPEAEAELVKQFLPMFYSIARNYTNYSTGRSKFHNLPEIEDIAQESFEPFRNAIRDFDPSRGVKFITLAEKYVRQHLSNILSAERQLRRTPTIKKYDPTVKRFVEVPVESVSLESPVSSESDDEDQRVLLDTIKDTIASTPHWRVHYDELLKDVENELDSNIKKEVFRKMIEVGLQPNRFKVVKDELGLGSSQITNIVGRDIYPAVLKVLEKIKEKRPIGIREVGPLISKLVIN